MPKKLNYNLSHSITDTQYESIVQRIFKDSDQDGDEKLDKVEFLSFALACARSANQDTDLASTDDGLESIDKLFIAFDVNGDGKISWKECWNYLKDAKEDLKE